MMDKAALNEVNTCLEQASPQAILQWAVQQFAPRIAATSSFQTQSLPLLHMIAQTVPELPVIFLDTGFHFPETLAYRDRLMAQFGLNIRSLTSVAGHDGFLRQHGQLYRRDPDLCCYLNKVEPLRLARQELDAWITGIRRDQTDLRRAAAIVTREQDGVYKICPMLNWTSRDVWRYIRQYELPVHPLFSQGYMSVGCAPCTRPVAAGEDERAGRWAGKDKTECGLHFPESPAQRQTPKLFDGKGNRHG